MLPVYYRSEKLTPSEISLAKNTWDNISNDKSPAYVVNIADPDFHKKYPTCIDWFTDLFYGRLFDIHPVSFSSFHIIYIIINLIKFHNNIYVAM